MDILDYLFDPFNTNKIVGLKQDLNNKFSQPRKATEEPTSIPGSIPAEESETWLIRWEQMICQLNFKASILFGLNEKIVFRSNCVNKKIKKDINWIANSYMCHDLIILNNVVNEDFEINNTKYVIHNKQTKFNLCGFDSVQIQDFYPTETTYNEKTEDTSTLFISKSGIFENFTKSNNFNLNIPLPLTFNLKKKKKKLCSIPKINIIKIIMQNHYTIALHYEEDNHIEYFDPSGTFDSVIFSEDHPKSGTLHQKDKLRKYKNSSIEYGDIYEQLIYNTLSRLFNIPKKNYVSINIKNLQIKDEDRYCQTWIFLYVYIRHVFPRLSTQKCIDFFNKKAKNPDELLELIEKWWDYLIYLNIEPFTKKGSKKQYNRLFKN